MWQITWMLSLLPDWLWFLILIVGVLGTIIAWVLKFIPFVGRYQLPIQVISILFLLVGVYFQGVIANEEKYRAEHERLKDLIARQEQAFKNINDELTKTRAERDDAISKKGQTIIRNIDRYIKGDTVEIIKEKNLSEEERKKLEAQIEQLRRAERECPIPDLLIDQLNQAAKPPQGTKK